MSVVCVVNAHLVCGSAPPFLSDVSFFGLVVRDARGAPYRFISDISSEKGALKNRLGVLSSC